MWFVLWLLILVSNKKFTIARFDCTCIAVCNFLVFTRLYSYSFAKCIYGGVPFQKGWILWPLLSRSVKVTRQAHRSMPLLRTQIGSICPAIYINGDAKLLDTTQKNSNENLHLPFTCFQSFHHYRQKFFS